MTIPEIIKLQDIEVTKDNVNYVIDITKSVWGLHKIYNKQQEFTHADLFSNIFENLWNKINALEETGFQNGMKYIIKAGV